jgi:hypothetical protein
MDYISPETLQSIQASKTVKCEKNGGEYRPPTGKEYCFLCPSEDLELTVPVVGADNFNEIVLTTVFGPNVAGVWAILIFEHIVFIIKFFVMALVFLLPSSQSTSQRTMRLLNTRNMILFL